MNHDATGLRPTFLVIGAYKAGTTSSHHYLKQHPQVLMSQRKEIRFLTYAGHERLRLSPVEFASLPWPVQTLPAYEALFAEATDGEASPRRCLSISTAARIEELPHTLLHYGARTGSGTAQRTHGTLPR